MTHSSTRRGGSTLIVVSAVVFVAAAALAAVLLGGGGSSAHEAGSPDKHVVERGSFEISVPASGELAALKQIEIRNRLEYRAQITEIVEEGTTVKEGDVLFRLAKDEIEDKIQDARDALSAAENAAIGAQSNLEIRMSERDSAIEKADLDVTLAELALEAWKLGEVVSKRQELALEKETARMDYDRLLDKYEDSKLLVEQEFISQDEFRTDEINMIKAKARLDQAVLDIEVYEQYEHVKQEAQKNSDVEQAKAERDRVEKRHNAEIERAQSDVTNKQAHLRSTNDRLEDLVQQLEYCTVRAPSGGLVVYANSLEQNRWSRGDRGDLQVGAEIRKNELVMVLPDTSQMTAEVKVNESLTGLIEAGQRAIVSSDAMPEAVLEGEVLSIGVLAESGGWRDPNRRDYTVKVLLTTDGNDLGLKPSMRCKAEIYVGLVEDAIHVPLQAVFHDGPAAYVYVPQGAGFAQRRVSVGQASGLHIEITQGLDEGETVLVREPQAREIVARLQDDTPADGQAALARPNGFPANGKGKNRPSRRPG